MDIGTPLIIFAVGADGHEAEAKQRGALGSTSDPQKLLRPVIDAIRIGTSMRAS